MTFKYPVNGIVLNALEGFPKIKDKLCRGLNEQSRSKLEMVRLLNNPCLHRKLLGFIEQYLDSAGEIGTSILNEADPVRFLQRLAELYLLVYLQSREPVNATPAAPQNSRHPDIILDTGSIKAKVEIYSLIENYGYQFIKQYYNSVFLWSECPRGYDIDLKLVANDQTGFHAYDIPNRDKDLRRWQTDLEGNVKKWLTTAKVGDIQEFEGVDNTFKLRASLRVLYDNPGIRNVQFYEPGSSTNIRLYFEGSPECNAKNQVGRKILAKLEKRQCGCPHPEYLRVLILNFELTDYGWLDWLSLPYIIRSIDQTIRVLVDKAGDPLPYDIVIPAMLDYHCYCCFGEAVILDTERETQIKEMITQTGLDQKCQIRVEEPPSELIKALQRFKTNDPV
ncbi:MAG: hypothetical protein OXD43_14735 [Bacteroidetes bacterium]|nr:hypothetical protein [Bacteroidota bacterium]